MKRLLKFITYPIVWPLRTAWRLFFRKHKTLPEPKTDKFKRLKRWQRKLTDWEEQLEQQIAEVAALQETVQTKSAQLDQRQADLDAHQQQLADAQQTLEAEHQQLAAAWQTLAQHQVELAQREADLSASAPPTPAAVPSTPVEAEAATRVNHVMSMQRYHKWNQALFRYVLADVPNGGRVFLAIDDDALLEAAEFMQNPPDPEQRVDDFIQAVRQHCVKGGLLRLRLLEPTPDDGQSSSAPKYLAFLAAMVLAAYRMERTETNSQTNYFIHLNEILGLPSDSGRPAELAGEERFWLDWAAWLTRRGYQPSAQAGEGAYKYIRYPISQALLRRRDKVELWHHFARYNWSTEIDDPRQVMRQLHGERSFCQHLRTILQDAEDDPIYAEGLQQAIYAEYDRWSDSDFQPTEPQQRTRTSRFTAGVYRTTDFLTDEATYWLFPRAPRQVDDHAWQVEYAGQTLPLTRQGGGWLEPLDLPLSAELLTTGLTLPVIAGEQQQTLTLPARTFWLLTADPDNPDTDDQASWGRPELGAPFTMLCRTALLADLTRLRERQLIDWTGEPIPLEPNSEWLELTAMRVLSADWTGVSLTHDELADGLKPPSSLRVRLRGGLRTPTPQSWLVGYGPELTLRSDVYSEATLTVIDEATNATIETRTIQPETPISLAYPVGEYTLAISVDAGSDAQTRTVKLVDWADLPLAPLTNIDTVMATNPLPVWGALLFEEKIGAQL